MLKCFQYLYFKDGYAANFAISASNEKTLVTGTGELSLAKSFKATSSFHCDRTVSKINRRMLQMWAMKIKMIPIVCSVLE